MIRKYSQILGIPLICIAYIPISGLGFALPKLVLISALALTLALTQPSFTSVFSSLPGKLFALYIIILVLSPLWSVAPIVSLLGNPPRYMGLLAHLCAIIIGISFAVTDRKVTHSALITANVLVVSYGILQMMRLDPFASYFAMESFLGRAFSTIGHPNALGQFIILTAPFLFALKNKTYVASLLILNSAVLLGTASRSALLGLCVVFVLFFPWVQRTIRTYIVKMRFSQAFAAALLVVLIASIGAFTFERRFSQTFTASRSTTARSIIWESTLAMIADRPMGWGLETMSFASPRYIPKEIYQYENLNTITDRAHNLILDLLVTIGPLGLAAFAALMLSVLSMLWKRGDNIPFAGLVGYLACVFFNFPTLATLVVFWVIVGYALSALSCKKLEIGNWILVWQFFFACIALVTLVVSVQWSVARVQDDATIFSYDRELLISEAEKRLQAGQQEGVDLLIDQLRLLTRSEDGMALLLEGWRYAVQGDQERAQKRVELAEFYFPESIRYHRVAAHIYETLGDTRLRDQHNAALINLLPPAYFDEGSQLRRILLKQHPWLAEFGVL